MRRMLMSLIELRMEWSDIIENLSIPFTLDQRILTDPSLEVSYIY